MLPPSITAPGTAWDGLRSQARGALPRPELVIFIKCSDCTQKKLRLGNIFLPSTHTGLHLKFSSSSYFLGRAGHHPGA